MNWSVAAELDVLAARARAKCIAKGWKTDWSSRGCYLHLEASELIEAIRGKRGTPQGEAADLLFVLLSLLAEYRVEAHLVLAALDELLREQCEVKT